MSGSLEVRLLGAFHIKSGKKIVTIASRPAQSLFAFLILNAGNSYRREKLAGLLWPDSTEESARDYLRHALWRIRKSLQEASSATYLKADDLTIVFDAGSDYWLDAKSLKDAAEAEPVEVLSDALSAYKGELLPGFYDEWVMLEREQLHNVYERKVACLLELLEGAARWSEVQEWGERWIALGQRPEAAYRHLMKAYAAQGDMVKAVSAYERCQQALADFGVEPSEQTRQLLQELKAGKFEKAARRASRSAILVDHPVSHVPVPLTGFIGREKELEEIVRLLGGTRLLTLVGPGGVGKTRLAIEAAAKLEKKFRDSLYWVDLVGLTEPGLVPQALQRSAGVPVVPNLPVADTLAEHFASRQCLVILDNCEHLIAACAQLAAQLLAGSKYLKILTTSREALDILGEMTWTVPSLTLPGPNEAYDISSLNEFESAHLFLERIASARPGFQLTEQNAKAVVQICNRLSGIPLALELAAARARMMSVEEIASRLDDSFDLLTAGNRGALPRHQTLRATIDWSHQLLTPQEQILFRRLAIFAGSFTLESAEAVTPDPALPKPQIIDVLGRLVGKSIVSVQSNGSVPQTRYFMLETIRQYAREKLDAATESEYLRARHLEYYAAFASEMNNMMRGRSSVESFQRAAADVENLLFALYRPKSELPPTGERWQSMLNNRYLIIGALYDFWESRYRSEIIALLKGLLAADTVAEPTRQRAMALCGGGFLLWSLREFDEAERYLKESIATAETVDDQLTVAWGLSHLGWNADFLGDYEAAESYGRRSLAIARALGDQAKSIVGQSLSFLGDIPYWRGDLPGARRLYEEAASFLREFHEANRLTYPVRRLGYVSLQEGNAPAAMQLFAESWDLNHQVGHLQGMIACTAGLAAAQLAAGNLEKSAILYGWVRSQIERTGAPFFFIDTIEYERGSSRLREAMDAGLIEVASQRGARLSLDEAIALALDNR